ncbi:MAG: hypothetical protein HYU69_04095 [Bacteroidetes bacterium]|nr:hypothetical protein [Bacteroidota bacterium]
MKQRYIILVILLITFGVFAQAPQKMSYQTVVRNGGNALMVNSAIGVQISILQGSSTGASVFAETHSVTTNANGLTTFEIGSGVTVAGSFAAINWGAGPYFIKTEIDPAGGANYTIAGTSELLSVPYSLFSAGAANAWNIMGNTGSSPNLNFIGTTDDKDLVFKRFNIRAGFLDATNTAFGVGSFVNISGNSNIAIGHRALSSPLFSANSCTAVGKDALLNNTTGTDNTAIGRNSMRYNTTGLDNAAIGKDALGVNSTGSFNTACGEDALSNNDSGNNNSAIGNISLNWNIVGNNNSAVGFEALFNSNGDFNTGIGSGAGKNLTTGLRNIMVGANTIAPSATANDQLNIGNTIYGNCLTKNIGINTTNPNSRLEVAGSLTVPYVTTASATGTFVVNDTHYTIHIMNAIADVELPNAATCLGRVYILIANSGIGAKNISFSGGGSIYDDVTNTNITNISGGQRIQIQSNGTGWIVIGR